MLADNRPPKRSILYYPTISVPAGPWLRQALLYWDEIGSIVPLRNDGSPIIPYTADIEYLKSEGEFRPFDPVAFVKDPDEWRERKDFEEELQSIFSSTEFQRSLAPKDQRQVDSIIHPTKVSEVVYGFLSSEGLVSWNRDTNWFLFERKTALLFMAILAKYMADNAEDLTVVGTGHRGYERFIYPRQTGGFPCLDTSFRKALPIPRKDVPLSKIVEFKRRRRAELLKFRENLDQLQQSLSEAKEKREVTETVTKFSETIQKELADLDALFHDSRIATIAGSFKTIISVKSPAFWATAVAASLGTTVAALPIGWTLAGMAVSGSIQVGCQLINDRNKKRAELRSSPFAYLYHARQGGLTES